MHFVIVNRVAPQQNYELRDLPGLKKLSPPFCWHNLCKKCQAQNFMLPLCTFFVFFLFRAHELSPCVVRIQKRD